MYRLCSLLLLATLFGCSGVPTATASTDCVYEQRVQTTEGWWVIASAYYHGPICAELMRDYPNQTRMVP